MKIETRRLENCEMELKAEIEPERAEAAKRAAARRLSQKRKIPGFRPGKAPYDLIVQHVGEDIVLQHAADDLGQKVYGEALDQAGLDPYAPGALVDWQWSPTPVVTFTVPLKPEVDLGEYRSVRLAFPQVSVSDEELNQALEHMREHQAVLEPVERPAEMGDVVTVDVQGALTSAGGQEPDREDVLLNEEGVSVLLDPEVEWPVPGFAERLVGIVSGEEREVVLSFPGDYANESLRGKVARFTAKCHAVKSRYLPEWDDDLARALGDYQDLLDLRVKVRHELEARARQQAEAEYTQSVVDIVVAGARVEYHASMLEEEISEMLETIDRRLREQKLTLKEFLRIENKTLEGLREEMRPGAEKRLKRGLVLGKVAETEGLDVEETEVDRRIEAYSRPFGEDAERLKAVLSTEPSKRSIALNVLTGKTIQRLLAIARGENPPLPPRAEAASGPDAAAEPDRAESLAEVAG